MCINHIHTYVCTDIFYVYIFQTTKGRTKFIQKDDLFIFLAFYGYNMTVHFCIFCSLLLF